jgi:macrolide-specific efflux system membrane fusion protein
MSYPFVLRTVAVATLAGVLVWFIAAPARAPAVAAPHDEDRPTSGVVAIARGEIDVDGGLIRIVTARAGRIAELMAGEGDQVAIGQILATLDSRATQLQMESARAALETAQTHARLLQVRRKLARRQLQRVEAAIAENASSPQALDEAHGALAAIDAEIADNQAAERSASIQLHAAQLDLEARTIRAPAAGRIAARPVALQPSLPVAEGTELFVLVPNAQHVVRAQIEEDFAGLIHIGMPAEVRASSDQGPGYPGHVMRVGEILQLRSMESAPDEKRDVRVVDCLLSVSAPELRVGQPVLVRFLRRT